MGFVLICMQSLIVLVFAYYVYENERKMLQFKSECRTKIDFLRKEVQHVVYELGDMKNEFYTVVNDFKRQMSTTQEEIDLLRKTAKESDSDLQKTKARYDDFENRTEEDFHTLKQTTINIDSKLNKTIDAFGTLEVSSKKAKSMTCPSGWLLRQLHCYIFIKTPKTWMEAADDCTARQAKLIKIDDSGMNSWVASQMAGNGIPKLWIGLNDRVTEGQYVWHGDSSKLTYGSWHRREPNNYRGEEDCVTSEGTLWNDIPCGHGHPYACEKQLSIQ